MQHPRNMGDWPTELITIPSAETEPKVVRQKLHPMQWATYITVIITCLVVLYWTLEAVLFLQNLSDVLEKFSNQLGEGI